MPRKTILHKQYDNDPSLPLPPRQEAFALAICRGLKLQEAHKAAGFEGKSQATAWQLRHTPAVDARIQWLMRQRVEADNRRFARRQRKTGDLLERVVAKLEAIAMTDIAEIADWRTEPEVDEKGNTQLRQRLRVRDAHAIPAVARSAIKGAFLKSGEIRLELHDQRAALVDLAKILKGDDVATMPSVTVNQVNVGTFTATDVAQRIAFVLAAAAQRAPQPATIEAQPVHESKDVDDKEKH